MNQEQAVQAFRTWFAAVTGVALTSVRVWGSGGPRAARPFATVRAMSSVQEEAGRETCDTADPPEHISRVRLKLDVQVYTLGPEVDEWTAADAGPFDILEDARLGMQDLDATLAATAAGLTIYTIDNPVDISALEDTRHELRGFASFTVGYIRTAADTGAGEISRIIGANTVDSVEANVDTGDEGAGAGDAESFATLALLLAYTGLDGDWLLLTPTGEYYRYSSAFVTPIPAAAYAAGAWSADYTLDGADSYVGEGWAIVRGGGSWAPLDVGVLGLFKATSFVSDVSGHSVVVNGTTYRTVATLGRAYYTGSWSFFDTLRVTVNGTEYTGTDPIAESAAVDDLVSAVTTGEGPAVSAIRVGLAMHFTGYTTAAAGANTTFVEVPGTAPNEGELWDEIGALVVAGEASITAYDTRTGQNGGVIMSLVGTGTLAAGTNSQLEGYDGEQWAHVWGDEVGLGGVAITYLDRDIDTLAGDQYVAGWLWPVESGTDPAAAIRIGRLSTPVVLDTSAAGAMITIPASYPGVASVDWVPVYVELYFHAGLAMVWINGERVTGPNYTPSTTTRVQLGDIDSSAEVVLLLRDWIGGSEA